MGTSFVTADGEHGFWMRDGILELWLRLLALHVPEPSDVDSEGVHQLSHQIRNQWLLASKGFFNGCVPSDMRGAVATKEGKAIVRSAIESLRKSLVDAPPKLDKNVLNLLGFDQSAGIWTGDFETHRLIETANAFLELLDGRIANTARDTSRMPGSN
jgi:hypothetical protein